MDQTNGVVKAAYSPRSAAKAYNIGVNKIYDWLNSGALEAKKDGPRTIITDEAMKKRVAALPNYVPGGCADEA